MSRTRKSAKQAGARFERMVADYLAEKLGDSNVDRQIKTGASDLGDIRGVYIHGLPVAVECKDYGGRNELSEWYCEAEIERGNKDAGYGVVVWKRCGRGAPEDQHVSMTLDTFAAIIAGVPVTDVREEEKWQ